MITEDKFDEDVAAGKRKEDNFVYSLKLNGKCYWYVVLFINYRFGYVIIGKKSDGARFLGINSLSAFFV